ncbi:MAG: hypothetical protein HKN10_15365 [Myxococcales bacterium]|nr:hypothetical protein [Deltaproteobacteria bacterium]NNE19849.1 hypothetical protein [Myxococcales bacterium]
MDIVFLVPALAVALFIFVMGAWGVFAPGSIFAFISGWSSKSGFWLAVLLRLCFGLSLWFAAPETRLPILLRVLGAVAILSAASLPMVGYERFERVLRWWTGHSPFVMRLWSLLATAIGGLVLWSLT